MIKKLITHFLINESLCCEFDCGTSRNQSKKELVFIIIKIQKRLEIVFFYDILNIVGEKYERSK